MMNIKVLIDKQCVSREPWVANMAEKMKTKFEKYWGSSNTLLSIAAVLDPRFKMKMIDFTFPKIYGPRMADIEKDLLMGQLQELFDDYLEVFSSQSSNPRSMPSEGAPSGSSGREKEAECVETGVDQFDLYLEENDDGGKEAENELEAYLNESNFKCAQKGLDFDAIGWWKANSLKFRVLSKMASEILSIPITTVASESTFSAGGRVIDQYRSSLGTDTVEVLLCGNDWLRSFYNLKRKNKDKVSGYISFLISLFYLLSQFCQLHNIVSILFVEQNGRRYCQRVLPAIMSFIGCYCWWWWKVLMFLNSDHLN